MGVAGLLSARTNNGASLFLVLGGIVLAVLGIYSGLVGPDSSLNVFAFDGASRWLHLVLGILMIVVGAVLSPRARRADPSPGPSVWRIPRP